MIASRLLFRLAIDLIGIKGLATVSGRGLSSVYRWRADPDKIPEADARFIAVVLSKYGVSNVGLEDLKIDELKPSAEKVAKAVSDIKTAEQEAKLAAIVSKPKVQEAPVQKSDPLGEQLKRIREEKARRDAEEAQKPID